MSALRFKIGDTVPVFGRIAVSEAGVDITAAQNFALWDINSELRTTKDQSGTLLHTTTNPWIGLGPLFDCSIPSSVTNTLTAGTKYYLDIRVRDNNGIVRSTPTRELIFDPAVSVTP